MTDRRGVDRGRPDRRRSAHERSLGRAASAAEGDLSLPKPPGVIRRFWARHPWWTDSLITAVYAIPVLAGGLTVMAVSPTVAGHPITGILGVVLAAVSAAAVLFRRRLPLIALGVTIVCAALTDASLGGFLSIGVCFQLYAVAVYRSNRAAWIGLACSFAALIVGSLLPLPVPTITDQASHPLTTYGVFMLLAVLIGVNIGNRKRYLEALIDRAAQLARERDQQARLATAAERSRIAREMHDIVSHSLTVMVSLADGSAALAATAPDRATDAMREVAETGRHALTDMRRMLGVLTESTDQDDASLEPQPGASDVSELVQRFRTAGLPARLTVTGAAPDDPGLQLTVYRVVQESLTNVLRHAHGADQVTITLEYGHEAVAIRVDDDGSDPGADHTRRDHTGSDSTGSDSTGADNTGAAGAGSGAATRGAGRGLVGMRERVALYRGSLYSGPRPGGGWRVQAVLHPLENGKAR